jgi:aryl-alcohol dehydrogenase-like predicted oxidoreductase
METLNEIRARLAVERRPASLRVIAAQAQVGYEWLVKFTHGHIGEPGATKLERLRQALDSLESRAA